MAAGSPVCTLDCCSVSGLPCCPVLSDFIPGVFSEVPKSVSLVSEVSDASVKVASDKVVAINPEVVPVFPVALFHWLLMMIQVFRRLSMLVKKKCLRRSSEVRVVLFSVLFVMLVFIPPPSGVT